MSKHKSYSIYLDALKIFTERMPFLVILTLILIGLVYLASANKFEAHDRVAVVANTVGPFNNPTETYHVWKYDIIIKSFYIIFKTFTFVLKYLIYGSIIPCLFVRELVNKNITDRILVKRCLVLEKLLLFMRFRF